MGLVSNGGTHELLLRHARLWAEKKKRRVDGDLLRTILDIRFELEDRAATSWPAGSAEDLLLRLWPSRVVGELPDPDVLHDSLDTYWRFLRATGRLASGSAEPATLLKEARRAIPRMAEAAANPANWSQGRVLEDFGRSIGVELGASATLEELQVKLDLIAGEWNALPRHERDRRSPRFDVGLDDRDASDRNSGELDFDDPDFHDLGEHGIDWYSDGWPEEDEWIGLDEFGAGGYETDLPADRAAVIEDARASRYLRQCQRLVDWVGTGREVTAIGVLRPPVAREAYTHLDLFAWDRARESDIADLDGEALALLARTYRDSWRSASECLALQRLWVPAVAAGCIEVGATKAVRGRPLSQDEADFLKAIMIMLVRLATALDQAAVVSLMTTLHALIGQEWLPQTALRARWLGLKLPKAQPAPDNTDSDNPNPNNTVWTMVYGRQFDSAIEMFDDTNCWQRRGDELRITHLGRDLSFILAQALAAGVFDEKAL